MASGLQVSNECVSKFQELKMHKTQLSGITFRLTDDFTEIVVDTVFPSGTSFTDFANSLPEDSCRYAVYDFHYLLEDGGHRSKLVFILWIPSETSTKSKMVTASSSTTLIKKLDVSTQMQAGDKSEITESAILEKCKRK